MRKRKSRQNTERAFVLLRRIALLSALGIAALPEGALAQTWIGTASGNWSAGSNWQGGSAPLSGIGTSLVFTGSGAQSWTATNDLGVFILSSLTFSSRSSSTPIVASAAGSSLIFDGASPQLSNSGAGNFTLSSGLALNTNTAISSTGFGSTTLSGVISGNGSLTIAGSLPTLNTQLLSLSGANTFTGGVTLNSGRLSVGNASALGTGTLTFNGGQLSGSATIGNAIVANATLEVAGTGSLVLSSAGSLSGSSGLTLRNLALLNVQNAATLSGVARTTFLNVGDQFTGTILAPNSGGPLLRFSGASGSGLNLTRFEIENYGTLDLDNSSGVNTNRISDSAPINLKEGFFRLNGNATLASSETVGAINGEGYNIISSAVTSATGANVQLTGASLNRVNNGTFLFRGIGLGNAPGAGVGNIFFTSAPTGDLVGGGGAAGSTNISILPYAIGDTSLLGSGSTLVTYGANGIRPLATSELATNLNTAALTDNVLVTASSALTGSKTVNSLVFSGTAQPVLSGTGTLTLTSGTLLSVNTNATNPINTIGVPLNFGTREANVFSTNISTLSLTQPLTGSGGFTKSGNGVVELHGNNTGLTGSLRINGGSIFFDNETTLPGTGTIKLYGGSQQATGSMAGLIYNAAGPTTINRPLDVTGGAGALGVNNNGGDVTFAGTISGDGGFRILTGTNAGKVILTGNNTYTGPTSIWGNVAISSDAAFGNGGSVDFAGGTASGLTLQGNWTTNRLVTSSRNTLLDTAGFTANLNGTVTGTGGFTKAGTGTLNLTSDSSSLTGGVAVNAGTYQLSGNGRTLSTAHTIAAGAALNLDNSTTALSDRINDAAINTLNGGEFKLTGNATTSVNELAGSLILAAGSSGNTVTVAGSGASTVLTFTNFTTNNAPVLFRGNSLGAAGAAQIFFTGLSSSQLLTNATYDSTITGSGTGATGGLAWYDTSVGVRKMLDSDFIKVGPGQGFTAIQNSAPVNLPVAASIWATGAVTTGASGESNTIGALRIASDSSVAILPGTTLTNTTGTILVDAGTATAQTLSGGTLTAGANPLSITQQNTAAPTTISSTLTGTGGMIKAGAGTLNLTGTYSITGAVSVVGGTLNTSGVAGGTLVTGPVTVASGASLATGAGTLNPTGTTAQTLLTVTGTGTLPGNVAFTNGAGQTTVATFNTGNATLATNVNISTVGGNTSVFSTTNSAGNTATLSGKFSGGSAVANTLVDFRNTGGSGGVLKLTNTANDFQATSVQVFSGTLAITDDRVLGNAANGIRLNGGTLRSDASISSARPVSVASVSGIDTNGNTLTLSGTLTSTGGTLNKNGTGTLNLTGTATGFASLTNVNNGVLAVNTNLKVGGAATTSTVMNINSGARLQGTGSVTPNSTNAGAKIHLAPGGTIAPGNSIGNLTLGNLVWDGGATMDFELGAPGVGDLLTISNATPANATFEKGTSTGTWNWAFTALSGFAPGDYTLATFSSTTFTAADMSYTGLPGYNGSFILSSTNLIFRVTSAASSAPEPGALVLMALGGGAGLLLRRRPRP